MNKVNIFNETKEEIDELKTVKKLLKFAAKYERLSNVEFNVIIVNNEYIHALNREYRHIDSKTDVISFALEDYKDVELSVRTLGDIYISIEQARFQAKEYGHSLLRELSFLSIHGFYHLLGYDHMKLEDEKVMFAKQEEVLDKYGISKEN